MQNLKVAHSYENINTYFTNYREILFDDHQLHATAVAGGDEGEMLL